MTLQQQGTKCKNDQVYQLECTAGQGIDDNQGGLHGEYN
jgi:hypothetical protein